MPDLFHRVWDLQVGTIRIAGEGAGEGGERASLDCAFEVQRSVAREPNTASVKIWNLSPSHRRALDSSASLALRVSAGYRDAIGSLFDGDVRVAESHRRRRLHRSAVSAHGALRGTRDIVDVITEIEAEDGGTAWRTATVQRSFVAGTPVTTVLAAAVDAMGIGRGNLAELSADATLRGIDAYSEGTVLSGQAHHEVDRIVRGLGLTWSVQSGGLQLKRAGQPMATMAVVLSPSTGLVSSPSIDADGYVTAVSLLNPSLYPGRPVDLRSESVSGSYQVRRQTDTGDTAGDDWYSEVTLEER